MTNKDFQKELQEKIKEGVKPSDLKKKPIIISEEENIILNPNKETKDLPAQINSLQKQLQTYKDFKEADLKIKEKLKEEIAEYKKTINNLQTKIKEQDKSIQ